MKLMGIVLEGKVGVRDVSRGGQKSYVQVYLVNQLINEIL